MKIETFFLKFSILSLFLLFVFIPHSYADRAVKLKLTGGLSSDRRIALVIGNSSYKSSPLKNPVNDAEDIANRLRRLGFEVSLGKDMNRRQCIRPSDNLVMN